MENGVVELRNGVFGKRLEDSVVGERGIGCGVSLGEEVFEGGDE